MEDLLARLSGQIRRRPYVKLLILFGPALAFFLFFMLAPLVLIAAYSFWQRGPYGEIIPNLTITNYAKVLTDPFYTYKIATSVRIAIETVLVALLIGYPTAYYIGRLRGPRKTFLLLLVIIPAWTSIIIRVFAWLLILSDYGFLNWILMSLNIVSSPLRLVHTELAVVVGLVHVLLPFMILPIHASVSALNPRLLESAKVLGAGIFRTFSEVTLRLTLPGIATGCLLVFMMGAGSFLNPAILGGTTDSMIAQIITVQYILVADVPFGSALSVVFLVFMLGIVAVFNRFLKLEQMFGGF